MNNCLSESGKAYGIITVTAPKKFISDQEVQKNIAVFYNYAIKNVDKLFFVSYDGINPNAISLNGKTRLTLARLFKNAGDIPSNVIFEKNFSKLILSFK